MIDAISLDDTQVLYASATQDRGGLRLRSTHQLYSYMAMIPLTPTTNVSGRYLEVEIDVLAGSVSMVCCDGAGNLLQAEALVEALEATQTQIIEIPDGAVSAVLRRRDTGDGAEVILRLVSICSQADIDPVVLKRSQLRTLQGSYVHYHFDLGDGTALRATRPSIMTNHRLKHRIIVEQIESNFGPLGGLRILDAGCAGGYHALNLAAAGALVVGIDPDASLIEQANFVLKNAPQYQDIREASRCRFEIGDVVDFSAAESFDVVLCTGVLYHLRNIIEAVNNLGTLARGAVIESAVSGVSGLTQALASSEYPCFEGEQAFVPTVELVETLMRRASFDVTTKPTAELVSAQDLDELDAIDRRFFTQRYFFIGRRS